ncbi:unnamed protein product [Angiostrongylus costaricensis]|uniref:DDE Tnp4 domain-containing protein n=1 Tax=Angiostrongylus costaricensis TaxID=334426 RepID=A0A0R3PTD6_ANGCS|nr:unnamed protein product [Angiostrongylus costaricensis]
MDVTGAFGDMRSVEREWGIRNQSVLHEHRFRKVLSKANPSTGFIKVGKHTFCLANVWCYEDDVISKARMV